MLSASPSHRHPGESRDPSISVTGMEDDLRQIQSKTVTALLKGEFSDIAGIFSTPPSRLSIYRNNTLISLTNALKATFPVTVQLADEQFFAYAAHAFITAEPPREARLSEFGGGLPRFLARFPTCRAYPVIAEMAAFEWAITRAMHGAETYPAPAALLERLCEGGGKLRLSLQPNLNFAVSRWNLVNVWMDHKTNASLRPLERRITRIAVSRRGDDIDFVNLDPARFIFWRSLAGGRTIEHAMLHAASRDPLFDPVFETLLLFRAGLVTGLDVEN